MTRMRHPMSDGFKHKLEHKLETEPADAEPGGVRRLELITGTGCRRRWSCDELASLEPGDPLRPVEKAAISVARPIGKQFQRSGLVSLHQRIRPVGIAPAKMESRASRSS